MTSAFFDADTAPEPGQPRHTNVIDEPATAPPRHGKPRRPQPDGLSRAALLQSLAALIWIPQAALLAWSVGAIVNGGVLRLALVPACLVLPLGVVRAALDAFGSRLAFKAARLELSRRRDIAVTALAARSPFDIQRPASGLAASLLGEQAEAILPYIARFLPARMKAALVPVVIFACVLPISWVAAMILLLTAPLIPVFMALIGWRAKEASEAQLAETGGLNAFLLDRLRGLATIRSLDAVDATARRLRSDAVSLRIRTMAVLKIAFLSSAVLELFAALGVAAVAIYVGFSLLGSIDIGTWYGKLTLPEGLFILLLAPTFYEPLRELSAVWHDRATGEAAMEALDKLSAPAPAMLGIGEGNERGDVVVMPSPPTIRLENLCFRRTVDRPIIDGLTLTIQPGEHLALLGASGMGKTTLLSLIAGLGEPDSGTIQIGRTVLAHSTADLVRRRMAWVGQCPHVFAGTISRNIRLDRVAIMPETVKQSIDLMHLGAVAAAHGNAPLGDGGLGLSGGEALRLALARAAADRQADIILADEPTAHLDGSTAADITDSLLAIARGRTLVVATHDPLLAARMDRIVRLDTGKEEQAA